MSLDADTAASAVSAGQASDRPPEPPDGMEVVAFLANAFNRPFTQSAVAARLPRGADLTQLTGLARAFSCIGLKSRIIRRDIARLDPVTLPVVLLRRGGGALVLTKLQTSQNTALVVDPGASDLEQDVTLKQLRRMILPDILLVTPDVDRARAMLSPEAVRMVPAKGHWFWAPVRANWSNWSQIVVAALLLNLMALALPLFVMNVYDKVIPNLAYVTLWTLAIGVGIALALDLMLRTIRGNVLENISRRVDLKVASTLFWQAMQVRLLDRPGGAAGIASTIRDFEIVRDFFASATFVAVVDLLFIGIFIAALYFILGPIA
ncbi:MAG: hypothetical protein PVI41_02930, partial [Roseobacter sp.]